MTVPSGTAGLDWGLVLGPRPADEALRALEEIDAGRPRGASDLGRAALLAMLGRIDEAWQLAEARSEHLREVSGDSFVGDEYLAAIAQIEGDRERACRHTVHLLDGAPQGSEGVMASYRSMLARDLYYLGRVAEVLPLLDEARAVGRGPGERTLVATVEALLLTRAGDHGEAEERARGAVATAERRRTMSGSRAGATRTSRWCSNGRVGSKRRGTPLNARWPSGSGSAACRTSPASASSSTRYRGRRSEPRSSDIPARWGTRVMAIARRGALFCGSVVIDLAYVSLKLGAPAAGRGDACDDFGPTRG